MVFKSGTWVYLKRETGYFIVDGDMDNYHDYVPVLSIDGLKTKEKINRKSAFSPSQRPLWVSDNRIVPAPVEFDPENMLDLALATHDKEWFEELMKKVKA